MRVLPQPPPHSQTARSLHVSPPERSKEQRKKGRTNEHGKLVRWKVRFGGPIEIPRVAHHPTHPQPAKEPLPSVAGGEVRDEREEENGQGKIPRTEFPQILQESPLERSKLRVLLGFVHQLDPSPTTPAKPNPPASQSFFAQTGQEVGRERNGRRGRTHPTTFSTPLNSFTIRSKHLPVTPLQLFSSHNLADPSWPEWASSF